MPQTPSSYYARRARQSHTAMMSAAEPGSRLAHAQLKAAYEKLDRADPSRTSAASISPPSHAAGGPDDSARIPDIDDISEFELASWANEGGAR